METKTLPTLEAGEYAGGLWYYEPHVYMPYRYVLGRPGARPLVCIGINPSTAQPGALDPTVKSVERLAASNGFDSWIMFNVYPQRATDPNDMDAVPDRALCDENLRWLAAVLAQTDPTMWAAWGTLIEKRPYLPALMREMVALTREKGAPWVTFGRRMGGPPFRVKSRCPDTFPHQRARARRPCADRAGGGGGPFWSACRW